MEIQCVAQLGTVECMRVDGLVRCNVGRCTSGEELQYELARDTNLDDCSHRVTKAEDATILDVEVDVAVGDLDTANDLACVDMSDAGPLVGVRVRADGVRAAHSGVDVLVQKVTCDMEGVSGEGGEPIRNGGYLEAGMGENGTERQRLSSLRKRRRCSVCDGVRCETSEGKRDCGETSHGSSREESKHNGSYLFYRNSTATPGSACLGALT